MEFVLRCCFSGGQWQSQTVVHMLLFKISARSAFAIGPDMTRKERLEEHFSWHRMMVCYWQLYWCWKWKPWLAYPTRTLDPRATSPCNLHISPHVIMLQQRDYIISEPVPLPPLGDSTSGDPLENTTMIGSIEEQRDQAAPFRSEEGENEAIGKSQILATERLFWTLTEIARQKGYEVSCSKKAKDRVY